MGSCYSSRREEEGEAEEEEGRSAEGRTQLTFSASASRHPGVTLIKLFVFVTYEMAK